MHTYTIGPPVSRLPRNPPSAVPAHPISPPFPQREPERSGSAPSPHIPVPFGSSPHLPTNSTLPGSSGITSI